MALLIIVLIVFFGLIIGAIVAVKMTLKKLDNQSSGVVVDSSNIKTAQQFLPFKDVSDGILDLGGFKYRKIIDNLLSCL